MAAQPAHDPFTVLLGARRGISHKLPAPASPAPLRQLDPANLELPSGRRGFAQRGVPPPAALQRADELLLDAVTGNGAGAMSGLWGWTIRVFTPRNFTDGDPDDAAWAGLRETYEQVRADGISAVFGDADDGHFAAVTPLARPAR